MSAHESPAAEAACRVAHCLHKGRDHLNLAGLGLTELPPDFVKLTGLRYLELKGNQLTALPRELWSFKDLRWLGLNFNRLQSISEHVGDLRYLQRLYLRQNYLKQLPGTIRNLHELIEIDLSGNRLTSLGEGWHGLTALEYGDVEGNTLDALPSCLGSLERLKGFVVTTENLPAELRVAWERGKWEALKDYLHRLDVAELEEYRVLALQEKRFASGHPKDQSLLKALKAAKTMSGFQRSRATIQGNVTRQAVKEDDAPAAPSSRRAFTGKLITIGDGGMGKTCLLRALKGEPFLGEGKSDETQGMEVTRLRVRPDGALVRSTDPQQGDDIEFHCWDMGGQEMYEYTHQIFFSDGAIYLGVIKAGERASLRELRRWLELLRIRTQRPGIHVIITLTRCMGNEKDDVLERGVLEREFPSFVFDYILVNSDGRRKLPNGDPIQEDQGDGLNIAMLRSKLVGLALSTAGFSRNWLPEEGRAYEALTRSQGHYLRLDEARKVCAESGIIKPEYQNQFLALAHEIGVVLWKDQLDAAREFVVLSPDWLSQAVARILVVANKPEKALELARAAGLPVATLIEAAGKTPWTGPVTKEQLRGIWSSRIKPGDPVYGVQDMPLLVELMEAYEISYRGKAVRQEGAAEERFLIASMVEECAPVDFARHWPSAIPFGQVEAVRFITFELKVGELEARDYQRIICRLIVRLHLLSLGVADITQARHWKSGLLIAHSSGARGYISIGTRELDIRVRAGNPQGLLGIILDAIGAGAECVIPHADVIQSVPCWVDCQKGREGKGRFSTDLLERCEAENKTVIDCREHKCDKKPAIGSLMHPYAPEAATAQAIHESEERMKQAIQSIKVDTSAIRADTSAIRQQLTDWPRIIELDETAFSGLFREQSREICQHMAQMLLEHGNHFLREMKMPGADGPRLFSIVPVEGQKFLSTSGWIEASFKLTLWCEYSLRPLSVIDGPESMRGIQTVTFQKPFLQKCLPVLKWMIAAGVWVKGAASLTLPEVAAATAAVGGALLAELTLLKDLVADLEKNPVLPADHEEGPTGTEWPAKFHHEDRQEHGIPFREMTAFALEARAKYKDKSWAGMEYVNGLWVHPRFKEELMPSKLDFR